MANRPKASEFPSPSTADRDGLVVIDPRISVPRMLDAYRNGIFPWPDIWGGQWIVGWYSPDPRAILPLDGLRIPRRLVRKLDMQKFRFSWDRDFDSVIDHCASVGNRRQEAWLSPPLLKVIRQLHREGHAHSIEVYRSEDGYREICGGLYGISIGASFAAESMFHLVSDASKAAIVALVALLNCRGYRLLDIQQTSPHLNALGAVEIARGDYLETLSDSVDVDVAMPPSKSEPISLNDIQRG